MPFGRYTLLIVIFAELAVFSQQANTVYMVYAGVSPKVHGCGNRTFSKDVDICTQMAECSGNETFHMDYQFYSVNIQWEHFCEKSKQVRTSTSLQMLGVVFGSVIFGQISDAYGRKWPLIISLSICTIVGYATLFVQNLWQFTVLRIIIMFCTGGHTTINLVFLMEHLPMNARMVVNSLISWSPNMIMFAIIAYFFQEWKQLAFIISTLTIPAIVLICFLHESPRWLLQKGRIQEAEKVIKHMRRIQGEPTDYDNVLDELLAKEHQTFKERTAKKYTFYHIFSRRNQAIWCAVISFSLLSTSIINYSLLFNLETLSGSIYVNSVIMGSIRWAVNILTGVLDAKVTCFGRKISHLICLLMIIGAVGVTSVVTYTGQDMELKELIRVLIIGVFAMTSQLYIVDGVVCNELFPTSIRTLCFAFVQIFSRGGVSIAPYLFLLASFGSYVPYFVICGIAIADMLIFQALLPESKNRALQDHIAPKQKKIMLEEQREEMEKMLELEQL